MSGTRTLHRRILPATLVAYATLLTLLYLTEGTHTDKEAMKYIGCAQHVLHGDLRDLLGNYLPYATYVLFLLPFVGAGMPALAFPVQVVISVLAGLALGRLATRISGNPLAGKLATALFLLAVPVQTWTLALYTESLFTSLVVLLLEQVLAKDRPGRWALPLAVLVLFGRPVGLLFVGPLLIWSLGRNWPMAFRMAGYAAVLLVAFLNPRVAAPQIEIILGSDVLCGCGTDTGAVDDFTGHSVLDAQRHLVTRHGVGTQVSVWLKRMASLFNFTRPHYSMVHNLVLLPWFLIYPFALAGFWAMRRDRSTGPIIAILVIYVLLVAFTCDEWSGRFIAPLFPLLIALACIALDHVVRCPRT